MNIHAGYFEIPTFGGLARRIDRWLNPYRHHAQALIRERPVAIRWTQRAEQALAGRTGPLLVEMQLYFSCVVKKRVLFHEAVSSDGTRVDDRLQIAFRPVEATSCSPEDFAHGFPVRREFDSPAAARLRPSSLTFDFVNGQWQGQFHIGERRT